MKAPTSSSDLMKAPIPSSDLMKTPILSSEIHFSGLEKKERKKKKTIRLVPLTMTHITQLMGH